MSAAVLYHSPEEAHRAGIASSNLTELYECRCLPHGGKPGCAEKLGGRQFLGIKAWGEHHQRVSQQHPFPEWATAPEMRYRQKEVRASKRPRHEESLQQLTTARESSSMDYDPLNDQDQDGEQDRAQGSSEANEQEDLEAGADSQQEHESGGEDDAGEDDAGEDDEDEEEQEKEDSEPTEEAEAELPPLPWEEELDAVNQVGRAFQDEEEQEWHRREEEEAEQVRALLGNFGFGKLKTWKCRKNLN